MDQDTLFKLLQTFDSSSVREMELDFEGAHIYLNKNQTAHKTTAPAQTMVSTVASSQPAPQKVNTAQVASKKAADDTQKTIKAQLVGVVYLQPAPNKDNYVHVGDHVKKGQTVCVIEAMKMLTEVKSDYSGTVAAINVKNEEMVDYDQPLMKITPDA